MERALTDDATYLICLFMPVLQGDPPALAILRQEADRSTVIKVTEPKGRQFHAELMTYVAELAGSICKIVKAPAIRAHLIFCGNAFQASDLHRMLAGKWPAESWSYVQVTAGAGGAARFMGAGEVLPGSAVGGMAEGMPHNRYYVPRLSIISALRFAYEQPGEITIAIKPDEASRLQRQMSVFSERAARMPTNDPEQVMMYAGEGLVTAVGVIVWHACYAASVCRDWMRGRIQL